MNTEPKKTAQQKFAAMEERQRVALAEEERALDATRAKTERLRALRLEKEAADAKEKAKAKTAKAARKTTRG